MYRDGHFCPLAGMLMGEMAELLVERSYGITREEQDRFALESHRKAVAAWESGAFREEVVPVEAPAEKGGTVLVERDERPRADTSLEKLARLRPAFQPDGTITAGTASGITDGAAARAGPRGAGPATGHPPAGPPSRLCQRGRTSSEMGLSPVPATRKLLSRIGLRLDDFDLTEVNEAFAAHVLAVERELDWDTSRRNVHGGRWPWGIPPDAPEPACSSHSCTPRARITKGWAWPPFASAAARA